MSQRANVLVLVLLLGCAAPTGEAGGPVAPDGRRLGAAEEALLLALTEARATATLPPLEPSAALDRITEWTVKWRAARQSVEHGDVNGRYAQARVRYYTGDESARCHEVLNFAPATGDGSRHGEDYLASPAHLAIILEEGRYDLLGGRAVGVAVVGGWGPIPEGYTNVSGTYSAVILCSEDVVLREDPFFADPVGVAEPSE